MHIGEKIKKLRELRGLTQAELARVAGIGQPYISKIERQIISTPAPVTVEGIARGLCVGIIELIDDTPYGAEWKEKFKDGIGYCPDAECPGGNYLEFENRIRERVVARDPSAKHESLDLHVSFNVFAHREQVFPEWEPYRTRLIDEDGEPISFCIHCGTGLIAECWNCGRKIKGLYNYCPGCGKPLFRPLEGEFPAGKGRKRNSDDDVPDDDALDDDDVAI
jgi:transcriptional regulator with XRE-family HTH domain